MGRMNLIIKGKHKKTLIFPVFSGDSVFNRIHDWLSFWPYNTRSGSYWSAGNVYESSLSHPYQSQRPRGVFLLSADGQINSIFEWSRLAGKWKNGRADNYRRTESPWSDGMGAVVNNIRNATEEIVLKEISYCINN